VVYFGVPYVNPLLLAEASGLPYPHVIIGVACTFLIAASTILYLRGGGRKTVEVEADIYDAES